MATYFLDTSALVKLYVREPGTDEMVALAAREDDPTLVILSLTQVELRSAIRRRLRAREISLETAKAVLSSFREHTETVFVTQPVTEAILDRALTLLDVQPLRSYDAVQLAGCIFLSVAEGESEPTFVCSDHKLLEAARAEGVQVFDPTA